MGSDKGLLKQVDLTWAEIAAAKFSKLEIDVVISVNREQFESYSKIFPADKLIVDDQRISVKGPLLGLLTVHQSVPQEDLCVLACDMVDITEKTLERLVKVSHYCSLHAYVFQTRESVQPLCAVYTSTGLENIYLRYQQNDLRKFSMMYVLDTISVKYIPADLSFEASFNNYNSPDQLTDIDSVGGMS